MRIYLIRHAQSTNNASGDPADRASDPALTTLGHRQAERLAGHLASSAPRLPHIFDDREGEGYRITHLYTSPMWRALQTAHPLGQALGLAPEVWIDVHEHGGIYLDHGGERGKVGYPGKTRSEIKDTFPEFVLPESITEDGWWNKGFEDWTGCAARALRVGRSLRQRAAEPENEERVAIVTHGGFINNLLKGLLGHLPGKGIWYDHYNTGITCLDLESEGWTETRVSYLNRVDHLPHGDIS